MQTRIHSIGMLAISVALAAAAIGCSSTAHSGRGESCRARNDCEAGLRCIADVCVQQDFEVAPTARSCDLVECTTDGDCCTPTDFPANCTDYRAQCDATSDPFYCDYVATNCTCREGCEEGRCRFRCTADADCGFGRTCNAGQCVECRTDTDCGPGNACRSGACVEACSSNADCPYFHACTAGECVEQGCATTRECIAFTGNPRAVCQEAECLSPCSSDAECNPGGYRFQECQGGQCVYVGCETDEECRIFLRITPGASQAALCR